MSDAVIQDSPLQRKEFLRINKNASKIYYYSNDEIRKWNMKQRIYERAKVVVNLVYVKTHWVFNIHKVHTAWYANQVWQFIWFCNSAIVLGLKGIKGLESSEG